MTDFTSPSTLRELAAFLLRERRLIAIVTGAVTVIALIFAIARPRTYTATAAFMSQARRGGGGLSSLAAQFGVVGADMGGESPQFYVDLISRQSTLRALADSSYPIGGGKRVKNLADYFEVSGSTPGVRIDRAVAKLRERLAASANIKTSVVTVSATAKEPELARALVDRAVETVNAFNLDRRKSQATAERDFAERRLAEAQMELRDAENRQEQFLQGNALAMSPRLRLESERLAREVAMKQAIYTTLAQSYEQARIDAVRDTPVLTMIESPVVPAEPNPRGLARAVIFGLFGGLALGVLIAYWRESWRRSGELARPQ